MQNACAGNVCRCGTYPRIFEAALGGGKENEGRGVNHGKTRKLLRKKKKIKVPKVVNGIDTLVEIEVDDTGGPTWGPKEPAHTLLNTRPSSALDGPAKATGKADLHLRCSPARHAVRTHSALAVRQRGGGQHRCQRGGKDGRREGRHQLTASKSLKYEGDPVAAVAAITPEIAEDAIRAIKVEYKKLPHAVTREAGHRTRTRPRSIKKGDPGNVQRGERSGDQRGCRKSLQAVRCGRGARVR